MKLASIPFAAEDTGVSQSSRRSFNSRYTSATGNPTTLL
jgi:hypothetical protein